MKFSFSNYRLLTYLLVFFSILFRGFIASFLEFGNDEVYYWLYALYPDISHFDHPPMVGFFIQFFTCDLAVNTELFVRLAAIIPSALTMLLVYEIARFLKDSRTGFIAVLLYHTSIYGLVISGLMILPDSPLLLFWMLSIYCFLRSLPQAVTSASGLYLMAGFLSLALGIYSKYQAVYLLLGVFLFLLFCNREWFRNIRLYIGLLFPLLTVGILFLWNYQNDFISFSFHNNRVSIWSLDFKLLYFGREILGQLLYNNPFFIFCIVLMFLAYKKGRFYVDRNILVFFMCFSIPLLLTVLYLSLHKSTLAHWSGVSYLTFIPVVAMYVSELTKYLKFLYRVVFGLAVLVVLSLCVVNTGWLINMANSQSVTIYDLGKKDMTLDMYGWKEASQKFDAFLDENPLLKERSIVVDKWFPGSHIHYYMASKHSMKVFGVGSLKNIHKYHWINQQQGIISKDVLFVTDSRNFKDPLDLYAEQSDTINLLAKFPVHRGNTIVKYIFVYAMDGFVY